MEDKDLRLEWSRMVRALCIEQDMSKPEIAAALDYGEAHLLKNIERLRDTRGR